MNARARDPYLDPDAEREALESAVEVFSAYREGHLQFDEHVLPVKFITEPEEGRLIINVQESMLRAGQLVLFVPEEDEDALQLLLSAERMEENALTDRWMAYHGEPEDVRWAMCWIDSVRHGPWVFDGDAFMRDNPLAEHETALCKLANSDKEALQQACVRVRQVGVAEPQCVGVDPEGLYVRARYGVIRVPFEQRFEDVDSAKRAIESLLKGEG